MRLGTVGATLRKDFKKNIKSQAFPFTQFQVFWISWKAAKCCWLLGIRCSPIISQACTVQAKLCPFVLSMKSFVRMNNFCLSRSKWWVQRGKNPQDNDKNKNSCLVQTQTEILNKLTMWFDSFSEKLLNQTSPHPLQNKHSSSLEYNYVLTV